MRRGRRALIGPALLWASLWLAVPGGAHGGPAPAPAPATVTPPARPLPGPDAPLAEHIDAALADPAIVDAIVGVSAVDLQTGKVLYKRGDATPLNPASNIKLVTTAAALGMLGPEHRYATRLYREDGSLEGDTVKGNVWLVGGGDPELVTAHLYEMATELHALGIRRITGGIVIDASRFDADGLPPGYDQKEELASYRAPVGAASVNFNTFVVRARPNDKAGSPPLAGFDPDVDGYALVNEATTSLGAAQQLWATVETEKGTTKVTLRGRIGLDAGDISLRYPVADPSEHTGRMLVHVLREVGVKVGTRKIKRGTIPEKARVLAVHQSEPLAVLVRGVNKFSNNFMAEQILKTLAPEGAAATFDAARERVMTHLRAMKVPIDGLVYGNGSGLYDTNRISPQQMTKLLAAVDADFRIRSDFVSSLSIMGADGTTRRRNREGTAARWVRAKTGTLDGVSCLSGYAGARARRPIAFAMMFNGLTDANTSTARAIQDRIAELLARHAAGSPLVTEAELAATTAAPPD